MIFKRWSRKGDTPGTFRKLYYYDDLHPLRYLCMSWVYGWVDYIAKGKCDLESLHPLPKADRLSEWQQTFSKYISDGVLQLELTESRASESTSKGQKNSCNHTIFLRAMVLTFWRRGLLTLLGSVCVSIISMTTAILLKYLFDILSSDSELHTRSLGKIAAIVMVVVLVESLHSTLDQHVQLYVSRLQICMEASIAITLFQHGLCYRRNYSLTLKSRDNMESCNRVLHYNDGFENKCSRNSLSCPAQRHQNRELPPSMYTHMVLDATAITLAVDSVISLVKFLCSFISGVAFVKAVMDFPILLPTITIVIAVVSMIFIELINGSLRNYSLESVDSRIAVSSDVLGNLELCTAMGVDDVCYRSIEYSRQDELSVLRISLFLRFLSRSVERSVGIVLFWVFVFVFNREVTRVEPGGALKFQLSELISLIFIITNIVVSCKHLPRAFRQFIESATSYGRVESFLRNCSPNFYLDISLDENDAERVGQQTVPSEMSADTLVYFKDVSFSYYSTRKQLLDEANPNTMPLLKSLNFILKRKDICIITGNQGSGKTSFIKSILGEMTLVSGSMAVAPLSTGMPIFYSSQDIWLPRGTIRSVITFGYTFDEQVYNQVLRSVELESDIQSWPDGDSRVISEQGYSLSGGQRVRVGLARALYAYMIFSKANEQLENRCCFLMCLDEPLEGLDMVVCQTIIYRLFNRIDGLLVRDDVAVVMSISNMSLDIGMLRDSPKSLVKMGIYVIEDNQLRELEAIGYERNPVENKTNSISDLPKETNAYHSFNRMSQRLSCGTLLSLKMNDPVIPSDVGNMDDAQSNSQECDNTTFSYTWSAYRVYLNAVSHLLFTVLMIFLGLSNVMVNLKLLVTARWVDGMRRVKSSESIAALMSHHQIHYFWITLLTLSSLVCFVILIFSVVTTSLKGSRCIHTFAINSIFQRTFGEFEFKERIGSLMTFLTSDIHIIDEMIASYLYESTFSLLAFLIKLASLFYIVPVAVPVPLVTFLVLYFCVHRKVLRSAKILQRLMLDANSNVNSVYNEVISGSSIYRSFCKERMWLNDVRLRSEEYYRTLFLKAAYTTWVSLITRLSVSVMIAIFIAIPILRSYLGHTELNVAHLGVGMSMCLGFGHSLQWLIINYAHLEKYMCSVRRFEDFFLKEGVSLKQKFESMDESIISGFRSPDSSNIRQIANEIGAGHSNGIQYSEIDKADPSVTLEINEIQNVIYDDAEVMEQLLHRRRMEYRLFQFRRYTSVYGWFLYKPRIDMLDASPYLSPNTTLELRGVAVVADSSDDSINKVYRLKPISSGAVKGDVIGIIGRTGAGKSTLLSVIQNVVPGRLGSVMLNGHDINMIPRRILRHLIGVLPQLPYIFKGWTLRRFVDPRMMYCDDEIMDAIERCGLTDLVNVFSRSEILDTVLISDNITARRRLFLAAPLGPLTSNPCEQCTCIILNPESSNDRQVLLSSSQQRQLMFARLVLYRNTFRILLIDEPPWTNNGAQDIEDMPSAIASEQSINSLVRRYFSHCITFIVAHDRHALQCCSRLWYVQDGHVSEDKSVEELLNEHFTDTPNM